MKRMVYNKQIGWHEDIRICPNCNKQLDVKETGHFVPPSFGESGFYICEVQNENVEVV